MAKDVGNLNAFAGVCTPLFGMQFLADLEQSTGLLVEGGVG